MLLMFMVAGIYFMKELLLFVFTRILLNVRSKSTPVTAVFAGRCISVCLPGCADCDSSIDQRWGGLLLGLSQSGFGQEPEPGGP